MGAPLVLLDGVTSSTTGPSCEVPVVGRDVAVAWVQAGPGGHGNVIIQASFDGSVWFASGALLSAGGVPVVISAPVRFIRALYDDGGFTGPQVVQALQSDEDG